LRRIIIQNPTTDKTYKGFLDAEYVSGTSLTVKSNVSFAANDLIVVSEPRGELSEDQQVASITGVTTITLSAALNFSHNKGTSFYRVLWNFVSIEARSSSAGVFAEITQSSIQWDDKNGETIFFHTAGTDSFEYRFRFRNSVTDTFSEYSPTITGAVPARDTVTYMVNNVRKLAGDLERKIVTDDEIIRFFNRAQDIIYARNPRYWFLLVDTFQGSNGIAATADTDVYSLATYTTFGHLDKIRYRRVEGATDNLYHLQGKSEVDFDRLVRNQNRGTNNYARFYKRIPADSSSDNGYFQVWPKTKDAGVGTFFPNYYEKMADLDTVEDTTQVPYPALLEDYAIAQVFRVKNDMDKAEEYKLRFFGPADRAQSLERSEGLVLLDQLDVHQRKPQGQPKSLFKFRGQKGISNLYGQATVTPLDQLREEQFLGRYY